MTFQDSNNNHHHHHFNKIKKTPVVATWPAIPVLTKIITIILESIVPVVATWPAIPVPRGSRTSGCC